MAHGYGASSFVIATSEKGIFKSWTILLSIFTFSLSLLGTFLVRSGILISVHSFANDPSRGVFILFMLIALDRWRTFILCTKLKKIRR